MCLSGTKSCDSPNQQADVDGVENQSVDEFVSSVGK